MLLFNKPFGVLCQFSASPPRRTLADFIRVRDVYPAGRLDLDSEGLVVLTNDGVLQARIAQPGQGPGKRYLVQVEGVPEDAQLALLASGVVLNDGPTRPAAVQRIEAPSLWPRDPPVRFRRAIPTAWLSITLHEGRNRQVRRMTASVGLPTLRLVRWAVGAWTLDGLATGGWREVEVDPARGAPRNVRVL